MVAFDEKVASVSERTGVDNVDRIGLELSRLDEDGIFVQADGLGTGRLSCKISWKAMGVEDGILSGLPMSVRSPMVGLLPDRYRLPLERPVQKGYAVVRRWGVTFTTVEALFGTSGYRYVPWQAWERFAADFAAEVERLDEAKRDVIDHYDEIIAEMTEGFIALANDAARRFNAVGAKLDSDFVATTVSSLLAQIPTREQIERISLRYTVAAVQLGSEVAEEKARQAQATAALHVANEEYYATEQRIRDQTAHERRMQALEQGARQAELEREARVKAELERIKVEAQRERLHSALSPLDEMGAQLHAHVHQAALEMAGALKSGKIHARTRQTARDLAEWFSVMGSAWRDDGALTELLGRLTALMEQDKLKDIDIDQTQAVVEEIKSATYTLARQSTATNRMGALEL